MFDWFLMFLLHCSQSFSTFPFKNAQACSLISCKNRSSTNTYFVWRFTQNYLFFSLPPSYICSLVFLGLSNPVLWLLTHYSFCSPFCFFFCLGMKSSLFSSVFWYALTISCSLSWKWQYKGVTELRWQCCKACFFYFLWAVVVDIILTLVRKWYLSPWLQYEEWKENYLVLIGSWHK